MDKYRVRCIFDKIDRNKTIRVKVPGLLRGRPFLKVLFFQMMPKICLPVSVFLA